MDNESSEDLTNCPPARAAPILFGNVISNWPADITPLENSSNPLDRLGAPKFLARDAPISPIIGPPIIATPAARVILLCQLA